MAIAKRQPEPCSSRSRDCVPVQWQRISNRGSLVFISDYNVPVPSPSVHEFIEASAETAVCGYIHEPSEPNGPALVLTHGAGADCRSKLLTGVAEAFAEAGFVVLRCNLPFRQTRPFGPPSPGASERDRRGLRRAVELIKARMNGPVFLGGHSYGGRQGTMLAADEPGLVAGLLLLSYPLHPPRSPEQLRTAHFRRLAAPSLFVHGVRDPFASIQELDSALSLIPGRHAILQVAGAGHELMNRKTEGTLASEIAEKFISFVS